MKGLIFSVRKYSVHDGPGIRVTFFMKGCPLNCLWCHNPEGILPDQQDVTEVKRIGEKEFSETLKAGEYYSVGDIMEIIRKEEVFINHSGGGVTFSGGEPLMQPGFLIETLELCKSRGYHTAVDTSGYAPGNIMRAILPMTDLFLFDIKHLDDSIHTRLTGVSNRIILKNFSMILGSGKDIFARVPIVPGYNDQEDHLEMLRSFFISNRKANLRKICLLPFHRTGSAKYSRLGIDYRMNGTEQPSSERMQELKKYFEQTGISVKIGG